MKTQGKVALILGLVCITIVILFGVSIYYFLNTFSFIDFYKRLETRVSIAARYNLEPDSFNTENLKALKEQHLENLDKEQEYIIEYSDSSRKDEVAGKYNLPINFIAGLIANGNAREKKGNTFYAGAVHKKENTTYLVSICQYPE